MRRSKHRDDGCGVIIDVHSGSAGIMLTHAFPTDKEPTILFSYREQLKIGENADAETLLRALRQALFSVAMQFSDAGMQALKEHDPRAHIDKVTLVCGAPWAETITRSINLEDETPFVVTKEKVDSLVAEAEKRDEEELKSGSLLKELNLVLVEHAVVHTAVNGYLTEVPYGKKATELTLSHISGLIPKAIIDGVTEIEDKLFPGSTHTLHTFNLVLFCVLRDAFPHSKNALYIDISGEATELSVVQDETLLETHVFPFGVNTLVRQVAKNMKTFPEEAMTHLKEYGDKTPEDVRLAIGKATESYTAALQEAYKVLETRYMIPRHFFFLASKGLDEFFETVIRQGSVAYLTPHSTFVSLHKNFKEGDAATAALAEDLFFSIEASFLHKLHACGELI